MQGRPDMTDIDRRVEELFALVSEALAGATDTLLAGDRVGAQAVVDRDEFIDSLTARLEESVWAHLDIGETPPAALRHLVGVLHILPELERSADLAEHIAQRAVTGLGAEMTPASRGLVQRMADVGLEMWKAVAEAFSERSSSAVKLDEADEELDILHDRLTAEVANGGMQAATGAQVTLIARFYERLGDHAVNLSRRIARLGGTGPD